MLIATQKEEIRSIAVRDQDRQKVPEILSQPIKELGVLTFTCHAG
jgi:hypothetical protein